jgi:uncharacterized protein (TIGR03435 family)
VINCLNRTMAQFAVQLRNLAPAYIDLSVADATGLQGTWDFTLSFSPPQMLRMARGLLARRLSYALAESEPTGAISIFDALEKQLGLELEARKRAQY